MSRKIETILGELVTLNTPAQDDCIPTTKAELLDQLTKLLGVSLKVDASTTFIIRSFQTPGPSDRDKIWFQFSANSDPISIKYFKNGEWNTLIDFTTEVKTIVGPSSVNAPPPGWVEITGSAKTYGTTEIYLAKRLI